MLALVLFLPLGGCGVSFLVRLLFFRNRLQSLADKVRMNRTAYDIETTARQEIYWNTTGIFLAKHFLNLRVETARIYRMRNTNIGSR